MQAHKFANPAWKHHNKQLQDKLSWYQNDVLPDRFTDPEKTDPEKLAEAAGKSEPEILAAEQLAAARQKTLETFQAGFGDAVT